MEIKCNSNLRWQIIKGNIYVDVRDMQLMLRATQSDSEIAKIAFRILADSLADFETKISADNEK